MTDAIKWSVPSFELGAYVATITVRETRRPGPVGRHDTPRIDDPHQLHHWLSHDGASIKFQNQTELEAHGPAFQAIRGQWITYLRE